MERWSLSPRSSRLVTQSAVSTVTGATEQQDRFGKRRGGHGVCLCGGKGTRNGALRTLVGDTVVFISIQHAHLGKRSVPPARDADHMPITHLRSPLPMLLALFPLHCSE